MTKRELIEALMAGKKMTSDELVYPDTDYCYYDENYLDTGESPFRFNGAGRSIPMEELWRYSHWREVKEPETFEPKKNDLWNEVSIEGEIYSISYGNSIYDNNVKNQGRLFRTREEAKKFSEWEKASYRLKKRIWELNGNKNRGFVIGSINYYIVLNTQTKELYIDFLESLKYYPSWYYLESRESAQQLIDEMEDDLKIYLGY